MDVERALLCRPNTTEGIIETLIRYTSSFVSLVGQLHAIKDRIKSVKHFFHLYSLFESNKAFSV